MRDMRARTDSTAPPRSTRVLVAAVVLAAACQAPAPPTDAPSDEAGAMEESAGAMEPGARYQPGTELGVYTPEQHPLYDGRWVVTGSEVYHVGTLDEEAPWDHMGDDGANLRPVEGTIEIDVNEIENTGTFTASLQLPEGLYEVELERFEEFSPPQDGGIVSWVYEHGDAGFGGDIWPKSLLYVAGWGWGSATLDGEPLREEHQIHFMVTQGMRDRETLAVRWGETGPTGAGAVNPAAFQIDFYVRSPETNDVNHPTREVFDHFFAMEVQFR